MEKHPNQVTITNGSPEELAETFGRTSYEYQKEFFEKLRSEYEKQSLADKKRGNPQLSNLLFFLALTLYLVTETFQKIWEICKPHMR